MALALGARRVVTPDGIEWCVGRRWMTRRLGWTKRRRGDIASESLWNLGVGWPDFGNVDSGEGLLLAGIAIAAVLIVIPLLFFGVELILVGCLLAAGVMGRVVFRRPWVIEARSTDPMISGRVLEWRVSGWRKSRELLEQIASDLAAGREPTQQLLSL